VSHRPVLAILLLAAAASPASAGPTVELGVDVGGHRFASDIELGVDDDMDEPGPSSSMLFGARLGLAFGRRAGVEGELVVVPTSDDVLGDAVTALGVRGQGVVYLLTGKLRPFVVAGVGALAIRGGGPQLDDDADKALHWGGGVRLAVGRSLDARVDLRHLIVPDRDPGGATSDLELQAGVVYSFGKKPAPVVRHVLAAAPPPAPPPPPPAPAPVRDRDGDGLDDPVDRCPEVAETANGWNDDDGCPDEILAELAGIEFERGSARIDPASRPVLDRTVQLLTTAPALVIEISGHTSGEGDRNRNLALSQARADAVKVYLIGRGIAGDRLVAVGHGPDQPIADDATAEGRRRNRRIELRIIPPGGSRR
jgi:OOP family OmpA-OmpF porin